MHNLLTFDAIFWYFDDDVSRMNFLAASVHEVRHSLYVLYVEAATTYSNPHVCSRSISNKVCTTTITCVLLSSTIARPFVASSSHRIVVKQQHHDCPEGSSRPHRRHGVGTQQHTASTTPWYCWLPHQLSRQGELLSSCTGGPVETYDRMVPGHGMRTGAKKYACISRTATASWWNARVAYSQSDASFFTWYDIVVLLRI